jgi:hypothetical protein
VATFIITGGRIAPEQVAGLDHNPWPTSSEYAVFHEKARLKPILRAFMGPAIQDTDGPERIRHAAGSGVEETREVPFGPVFCIQAVIDTSRGHVLISLCRWQQYLGFVGPAVISLYTIKPYFTEEVLHGKQ